MRRCCPIATIVELVTEIIEPVIQAPFELVDVEYEKVVGDYVLSIFVDKPGGITLNDTADLTEVISPSVGSDSTRSIPGTVLPRSDESWFGASLKTKDAVEKALGQYIHVSLYKAVDKQKVIEGTLVKFEDDQLTMEYMDKTRKENH